MELKIFWTDFAKSELNRIYIFYKDHASTRVAKNETKKIARATVRLKKQPEIGQVEELLKGRSHEFRYLVHQSYKIVYWINRQENQVEIVDVFHTRQYPEKIKRSK
jgi:plasmid stabilization system protein ParE